LLSQRSVDRYGDGALTLEEESTAFADLVRWVQTGASPL